MKIEGYIEIKFEELIELPAEEKLKIYNYVTEKHHYFKKIQKFPIVFEDEWFRYELLEEYIRIMAKNTGTSFRLDYSNNFPLLVKAVEKAKEIMKKNETN